MQWFLQRQNISTSGSHQQQQADDVAPPTEYITTTQRAKTSQSTQHYSLTQFLFNHPALQQLLKAGPHPPKIGG